MVNEFDKEIDAMLRDLAKNPQFAITIPQSVHLDADEISAFAENVLPNKARVRVTEHLADCSKCRKILANVAFLNSEAESEIIHEEAKPIVSLPAIPWYQRLFAVPNLAYTMGALALVLVGMVGLLVLQNSKNSEPMVAQSNKPASEKASGPNAGNLEGDFPYTANSNAASVANAPSAMATPAFGLANSAANTAPSNVAVSKDAPTNSPSDAESANTSTLKTGETDVDDKVRESEEKVAKGGETLGKKEDAKPIGTPATEVQNDEAERRDTMNKQNEVSQTRNIQTITPDGGNNVQRNQIPSPPSTTTSGATGQNQAERPEPKSAKKMSDRDNPKDTSTETRKIGSKSFRKIGGVWTDTSYSGGSTQTVKRGSDDFKKLDSNLQNLANSLGGSVIVVWGGKNYKIQ